MGRRERSTGSETENIGADDWVFLSCWTEWTEISVLSLF